MKQEIAYLLSSVDGLEDFSTDYPQEMATFPLCDISYRRRRACNRRVQK